MASSHHKPTKKYSFKMAGKSKILIIGGTGYIGKFIVEASAAAGHPTFVLVRESTLSDPQKSHLIQTFINSGVNIILVSSIYIFLKINFVFNSLDSQLLGISLHLNLFIRLIKMV